MTEMTGCKLNRKLTYSHPDCFQELVLDESVIAHFEKFLQTEKKPEVGGQLFGKSEQNKIIIFHATGPYKEDRKSRYSFIPKRSLEIKDIQKKFDEGFHFLGDWHTHPESNPKPSPIDIKSMSQCFRRSKHQHQGFIMIIVGNQKEENWLSVTVHNGSSYFILNKKSD